MFLPAERLVESLIKAVPQRDAVAQKLLFIIGSGLSLPRDAYNGVPGTGAIVERLCSDLTERHATELRAKLADPTVNAYQAAFEFLDNPDRANLLITSAVLEALKDPASKPSKEDGRYENTALTALESVPGMWSIRPCLDTIARLFAEQPDVLVPYVLTTNFDPLIESALRTHRVPVRPLSFVEDLSSGAFSDQGSHVHVIHLHGYWRDIDSLHTRQALTQKRPRLRNWILNLLQRVRVVVLGCGGWNDLLMECLLEAAQTAQDRSLSVDWTFFDAPSRDRFSPQLSELHDIAERHANRRIFFYKSFDSDKHLSTLLPELKRHRPAPRARTVPPKAPKADVCERTHQSLVAIARAQRFIAMQNFRVSPGVRAEPAVHQQHLGKTPQPSRVHDSGYGWRQELKGSSGAPSTLATAQALMILEGVAAPAPLLVQLLAQPLLDRSALTTERGGWGVEDWPGRPLVRVTAFVLQVACNARFCLSQRAFYAGLEYLLRVQHSSGGWGFHDKSSPDVVSTAQACSALSSVLRFARDAIGELIAVRDTIAPVEDAVHRAIAGGADFLIVRQAHGGADRGRIRASPNEAGEASTTEASSVAVPRAVRTAEACMAFRTISETPNLEHHVRARCSAALERASSWLVRQVTRELEGAKFQEGFGGGVTWSHCVPEAVLRGLLAGHIPPSTPEALHLVEWILDAADERGTWSNQMRPGEPATFATKDAVVALREFVTAVTRLNPGVLLDGPRMAAVDASHYGVYRGGLFGVTVMRANDEEPSKGLTRKVVRHDLPFSVPHDDMNPDSKRPSSILRTRLLVDIVARSLVESVSVQLERQSTPLHAAIAVLRGGLAFVAPLVDTLATIPLGLVSASRAQSIEVSWQVCPDFEHTKPVLLVADLVANTGATLAAVTDAIIRTKGWEQARVVIACAFAHVDALKRLEGHACIDEIHVAEIIEERSPGDPQWLARVGFDAGDILMGKSRRLP